MIESESEEERKVWPAPRSTQGLNTSVGSRRQRPDRGLKCSVVHLFVVCAFQPEHSVWRPREDRDQQVSTLSAIQLPSPRKTYRSSQTYLFGTVSPCSALEARTHNTHPPARSSQVSRSTWCSPGTRSCKISTRASCQRSGRTGRTSDSRPEYSSQAPVDSRGRLFKKSYHWARKAAENLKRERDWGASLALRRRC